MEITAKKMVGFLISSDLQRNARWRETIPHAILRTGLDTGRLEIAFDMKVGNDIENYLIDIETGAGRVSKRNTNFSDQAHRDFMGRFVKPDDSLYVFVGEIGLDKVAIVLESVEQGPSSYFQAPTLNVGYTYVGDCLISVFSDNIPCQIVEDRYLEFGDSDEGFKNHHKISIETGMGRGGGFDIESRFYQDPLAGHMAVIGHYSDIAQSPIVAFLEMKEKIVIRL